MVINTFSNNSSNEIQKCGCIIKNTIDLFNNKISNDHIQVCHNHFKQLSNSSRSLYTTKQKKSLYTVKTNNKILVRSLSENDVNKKNILNFGKYNGKSFEYVFSNDKFYSARIYNMIIRDAKNTNIISFQKFLNNKYKV